MEIEHIGESPHCIRFRFDADETEVLRSVYREKIAALARACNPSAIKPEMVGWANMPDRAHAGQTVVSDELIDAATYVTRMTVILSEFADNTNDVLAEIALETKNTPGFANHFVPLRFVLGEKARQLVEEISSKTATFMTVGLDPNAVS